MLNFCCAHDVCGNVPAGNIIIIIIYNNNTSVLIADTLATHPYIIIICFNHRPDAPKAEQLQQSTSHTMYIPVDPDWFDFANPIKFGNRVYAQVRARAHAYVVRCGERFRYTLR